MSRRFAQSDLDALEIPKVEHAYRVADSLFVLGEIYQWCIAVIIFYDHEKRSVLFRSHWSSTSNLKFGERFIEICKAAAMTGLIGRHNMRAGAGLPVLFD